MAEKRKRTCVVTIESDSSDIEILSDSEYLPSTKKAKRPTKVKNEPKPKTTTKKKLPATKNTKKNLPKTKNTNKTECLSNNLNIIKEKDGPAHLQSDVFKHSTSQPLETKEENTSFNFTKEYNSSPGFKPWTNEEVVAENCAVPLRVARQVISLLEQDCTVPFIVRYRREKTDGLETDKIRDIQEMLEEIRTVRKKVDTILKSTKHEKFDESITTAFLCAKSLDEVELLYAPFKPGGKRTLAERSKQLGLEPLALQVMSGQTAIDGTQLLSLVTPKKGLESEKDILSGIQHIIADKISKDSRVLDFIRENLHHPHIRIQSCKSAGAEKEDRQAFVVGKTTQNFKFENYYQFNNLAANIHDHQVMALNRGEKQKVLKVKVELPQTLKQKIKNFIWCTFFGGKFLKPESNKFLHDCSDDAYERLVEPYMCRRIRSELTKKAEKESIRVFGCNVSGLLLTPPVRGKTVIGIDPGFTHGCKVAALSPKGEVLGTDVIYPHQKNKSRNSNDNGDKLYSMISSFGAEIIAIGNGTACRETEVWLSDLIKLKFFHPFEIKYCIVNENGASIYSITKEAEAELPGLDPNLRSAVSIARRLQDPLLEYVKIEPKHLGVGMYQHDVPEAQLKKALDGIMQECVSFVGVDLNVCSEILLRKISGLSLSKAKAIVDWRKKNGNFINRQQLLKVKSLGNKTFEQCAGFVKILPQTAKELFAAKKVVTESFEPLDRTIIHPESYDLAKRFLKELKAEREEIGQQSLKDKVTQYMRLQSLENVAEKYSVPSASMLLVIEAFQQLQDYDYRAEFDQPLFHTSVCSFADLRVNQELTGRVTNVTGFGAFVDAGVGTNGLIHISKMKGRQLNVNDRVKVRVLQVDAAKKRIALELCN